MTEPKRSFTPRGFENFLEMRDTKNQRIRVRESSVDDNDGSKCVHIFCPWGAKYPALLVRTDMAAFYAEEEVR